MCTGQISGGGSGSDGPGFNSPIHRSGIGNERTSSYWQSRASTNGCKTLNPSKAAQMAMEAGDKHAAYRLDSSAYRQTTGNTSDTAKGFISGFNFNYPGRTWEGSKGHPAERQMYNIPSDKKTIQAIPKLAGKLANFSFASLLSNAANKNTSNKKDKKSKVATQSKNKTLLTSPFQSNDSNPKYTLGG